LVFILLDVIVSGVVDLLLVRMNEIISQSHLVSTVGKEMVFMAYFRNVAGFAGVLSSACDICEHLEGLLIQLEFWISLSFDLIIAVTVDEENLLEDRDFLSNTPVHAHIF